MVATVRLNDELEELLNRLTKKFHKKKSEIIREALLHYGKDFEHKHKSRMQKAMAKTAKEDYKEYKDLEEYLNDGL